MLLGEGLDTVTCIMPTADRRPFVPSAIDYFLRQDYPAKALLIVDDGADPIADLVPQDERISYLRLERKITLGAKLNLACEHARSPIIAHWDDDDWYAPWRLRYQVGALRGVGKELCGLNDLLYYDVRTGKAHRYVYPPHARPWLLGSSLCYTRALWSRIGFAEIQVGMDGLFVRHTPPRKIEVLRDPRFAVHIIHDGNVSPKHPEQAPWRPFEVDTIRQLTGEDWSFYDTGPGLDPRPAPAAPIAPKVRPAAATKGRNVLACAVHERPECVADLVRNLRHHAADCDIILYNGSRDPGLLETGFRWDRFDVAVHPRAQPAHWGRLHEFAVDVMRFALEQGPFDSLTIVDSDQLLLRPGYASFIGGFLAGHPQVGLLGNDTAVQSAASRQPAAAQAWRELDLWRPWLQQFPDWRDKFVHWSFWPGTVFSEAACRAIVERFDGDAGLRQILLRSSIPATEEVVFPTLLRLLGFDIALTPCRSDLVKYRVAFDPARIAAAQRHEDLFWIHPVPRSYSDPLRRAIREAAAHYGAAAPVAAAASDALLVLPIIAASQRIPGWLTEAEADLLIAVSRTTLQRNASAVLVEVGSYCGRATAVMGSVVRRMAPEARIHAIDRHDGQIGALDGGLCEAPPSFERLRQTVEEFDIGSVVELHRAAAPDLAWSQPIDLLLIDGLHDYYHVARDFHRFEPHLREGATLLFHDYACYYPGITVFVDELVASGRYCIRSLVDHLVALERVGAEAPRAAAANQTPPVTLVRRETA